MHRMVQAEQFAIAHPPSSADRNGLLSVFEGWIGRETAAFALPPSQSVPVVYGPPDAGILDLPQLSEDIPVYRPLAAVAASPWHGQVAIWRSASLDGLSLFATTAVPAKFGSLAATLGAGPP